MSDSFVCLMYHDVTAAPARTGAGPARFSVTARDFRRQLDMIAALGYLGCSLETAIASGGARRVAITFDDGDVAQATRAFPSLLQRGMTATFFVTTDWVGRPRSVSWDQLREMRAAGMSIQSHTHTHPFLSELDEARLREELQRSRDLLDEQLGQCTTMIALPGGDLPRRTLVPLLEAAGYGAVATSRWGTNVGAPREGMRFVQRCTVRGAPSEAEFSAILAGDRWLGARKHLREGVLALVRSGLGPTRYSRLRRVVLSMGTRTAE